MRLSSIGAAALVLSAFLLRCIRLGAQSLWFDEGWSWHLARLPLLQMADITAGDRSPAFYYAVLGGWVSLAGDGEFAMRALSVMADVAAVALMVPLAALIRRGVFWRAQKSAQPAEKADEGVAPLAPAAAWAMSPFALWYAQETRMYALLGALVVAACLALLLALRSQRTRAPHVVAATVLFALAMHTHYYAVFALPAFAAIVLVVLLPRARSAGHFVRLLLPFLLAFGGVLLAVLPWLAYAARGFAYSDGFASPINTIDGRLREWFASFAAGGPAQAAPAYWAVLLIATGLLCGAGAMLLRRHRQLLTVMLLACLPLLAATAAVRLFFPDRSVFHPRYLIYCGPFLLLLLALPNRALAAIGIGALALLAIPNTVEQFTRTAIQRDDVRAATAHVIEAFAPGDAVLMSRDNYAVRYYDRAGVIKFAAPYGLHGVLRNSDTVLRDLNSRETRRVRLMLWQDDVVDPQKLIEQTMWANGYQIGELNFGLIRLPLYQLTRWPVQPPEFTPIAHTFDGKLALEGYAIRANPSRSNWLYVSLQWRALSKMDADYKVFIHVLDEAGNLRFQQDELTLNTLVPTSRWPVGAQLRDGHAKAIPPEVPSGKYRVVVGVYDSATGERLHTEAGDSVTLATVGIER